MKRKIMDLHGVPTPAGPRGLPVHGVDNDAPDANNTRLFWPGDAIDRPRQNLSR
jgi:hypothetical protein